MENLQDFFEHTVADVIQSHPLAIVAVLVFIIVFFLYGSKNI